MVGYQVVDVFLVALYQPFFQHQAYLADLVEIPAPDIGIGDSPRHPQPLQGLFADFQKGADFVTVHPHVILVRLFRFKAVKNVIRYGGNLVFQFLLGF